LPLILYYRKEDADYLETCRAKRNAAEHEITGVIAEKEVSELVEYVKELREDVLYWLGQCRPELFPNKPA
ncbi:MAG TPA: hypothetical protein VHQ95_03415, partial [Pyrinomonadaceae bacterium]|nr:hypothetical protein [Pyrinomonadaceae bacterium]